MWAGPDLRVRGWEARSPWPYQELLHGLGGSALTRHQQYLLPYQEGEKVITWQPWNISHLNCNPSGMVPLILSFWKISVTNSDYSQDGVSKPRVGVGVGVGVCYSESLSQSDRVPYPLYPNYRDSGTLVSKAFNMCYCGSTKATWPIWLANNKQTNNWKKTQTEVKYLIVSTHWCLVLHIKLEKSLLDCLLVFSFLLCLFWFELLFLIFMLCAFLVQLLTQMTVMRA